MLGLFLRKVYGTQGTFGNKDDPGNPHIALYCATLPFVLIDFSNGKNYEGYKSWQASKESKYPNTPRHDIGILKLIPKYKARLILYRTDIACHCNSAILLAKVFGLS